MPLVSIDVLKDPDYLRFKEIKEKEDNQAAMEAARLIKEMSIDDIISALTYEIDTTLIDLELKRIQAIISNAEEANNKVQDVFFNLQGLDIK